MADYTDRIEIDTIFGSDNIDKWADLDDDADSGKITARINAMLTLASREFDASMRDGPYDVADFTSTEPLLKRYVGIKAGLLLYELRGLDDTDEKGKVQDRFSKHRKMYESFVTDLLLHKRRLDPAIVDFDVDIETNVPKVWTQALLEA